MSVVAEFAGDLHARSSPRPPRTLRPVRYASKRTRLFDIRAVICDVYGTLVDYWRPEFDQPGGKDDAILGSFGKTIVRFGMEQALRDMEPAQSTDVTLRDLYHGLIGLQHEKAGQKGNTFPEIKIEQVWVIILMMLGRHGYSFPDRGVEQIGEQARLVSFYYNFQALGRGLFPGVVPSLRKLRNENIRLGLLSNAQFYTPLDLTLFVRDQSGGQCEDYLDLFDIDLSVFSFEAGSAKPSQTLFERLFDALREYHILPSQTVLVGNDLSIDIKPAQEAGMATALFTGDHRSTFFHGLENRVFPDLVFSHWSELPDKISFFEEKPGGESRNET